VSALLSILLLQINELSLSWVREAITPSGWWMFKPGTLHIFEGHTVLAAFSPMNGRSQVRVLIARFACGMLKQCSLAASMLFDACFYSDENVSQWWKTQTIKPDVEISTSSQRCWGIRVVQSIA